MLTFLTPAALFGLLLLAVPVVVHLFKPRKMRRMPFSSLRFLHATQQRLSRRIQWHQLLLFAVRAAFIVLLVLALAHPIIGGAGAGRPVDRYVVLDVSRSMGYQMEARPTPLERGKEFAAAVLNRTGPGDRAALLFTGARTRLATPLTPDPRPFLPVLQAVEAAASDTRLGSALTVLRPLLAHPRDGADVEVYFITDLPRQGWSQAEAADFTRDLPDHVHIRIVDVGVAGAQNAWVASARLLIDGDGRQKLRVELGACGEPGRERTLRVLGLPGDERSLSVTPEPGQVTAVEFELPPGSDLKGKVAQVRLEPADSLPGDDELFVNLDAAGSLRVLLVEPAAPEGAGRSRLHLRDAIEAQRAEGERKLDLVNRTSATVAVRDVAEAEVILLAGVPDLPDGVAGALRQRVRAGAGLIVFLGDEVRPTFYNEHLYDPLHPAGGLLPCPLGARTVLSNPSPLARVRYTHRLLMAHDDPVKGDLAAARFNTCYRFSATPGEGDAVLARLEDDTPLLVEHPAGAGRVLLFNTSARDDWSTLPRRASFVPLIDQALAYLTAGGVRHSFTAGEPVTLPLPDWKPADPVVIRGPGNRTLKPAVSASGGAPFLQMDEVAAPGIYTVEYAGKTFPFVVNTGREDALLARADPAELAAWWSPLTVEVLQGDEAKRKVTGEGGGQTLLPWLIGAAVALLLLETYLVHFLCPRVNPTAAEVIVHRRGLLRPTGSGAGDQPGGVTHAR